MAAGHPAQSPDRVVDGWRALAQRRHAHYLELLQNGRWRRYFSEQEFAERLRDVMASTRAWDALAERPETPVSEARPAA